MHTGRGLACVVDADAVERPKLVVISAVYRLVVDIGEDHAAHDNVEVVALHQFGHEGITGEHRVVRGVLGTFNGI